MNVDKTPTLAAIIAERRAASDAAAPERPVFPYVGEVIDIDGRRVTVWSTTPSADRISVSWHDKNGHLEVRANLTLAEHNWTRPVWGDQPMF